MRGQGRIVYEIFWGEIDFSFIAQSLLSQLLGDRGYWRSNQSITLSTPKKVKATAKQYYEQKTYN